MKISVIIPLYNKAPYIRRGLDSVRKQIFQDFEVIVVDDGSTDEGPAIVRTYPDPRVRLVTQKNAGPGAARNRGLEEARGAYVTFLDADDEWLPRFLETSLRLLEKHGPEVASVSSAYTVLPCCRSTEALWRKRGLKDGVYRVNPLLPAPLLVHLLAFMCPWNTVARTERVRHWQGFYSKGRCLYGEDAYLWLKFLLNESVAVHLEPLVNYHTEASALAHNLKGPRPVEPLLSDPAGLYAACPDTLKDLLGRVLAIRALKTACMLSYWGRWREGRKLLQRFCPWSAWRLPRFGLAMLCVNPLGAGAGAFWRLLRFLCFPARNASKRLPRLRLGLRAAERSEA